MKTTYKTDSERRNACRRAARHVFTKPLGFEVQGDPAINLQIIHEDQEIAAILPDMNVIRSYCSGFNDLLRTLEGVYEANPQIGGDWSQLEYERPI